MAGPQTPLANSEDVVKRKDELKGRFRLGKKAKKEGGTSKQANSGGIEVVAWPGLVQVEQV